MKKFSLKKAIATSALTALLSCSMLVGTTFAWFTDSATSAGNKIVTGTLKVDLEVLGDDNATWSSVKESKAPIFTYEKWEPGYMDVTVLKVENEGSLALQWQAVLRATGEVGELAEVISVYVLKGEMMDVTKGRDFYADKLDFVGNLEDVLTGPAILSGAIKESQGYEYVNVVLTLPEEVGNDYQGKSVGDFDMTVLATQYSYEKDSYDEQYDIDATIDAAVLAYGGIIDMEQDVNGEMIVSKDAEVTLNMNGKELNNNLTNNGEITVSDGTINATGENALYNEGKAELKDVTINMTGSTGYITNSRMDGSVTVYENVTATSSGGGVNVWEGEAVFKSGTITTNSTSTSARHMFYVADGASLTIEDGEFIFNPTNLTRKGSYICAQANATVIVNGGVFHKPSKRTAPIQALDGATVTIYGGKFQFDPSAFVADGYQAVEVDGWWTVSKI